MFAGEGLGSDWGDTGRFGLLEDLWVVSDVCVTGICTFRFVDLNAGPSGCFSVFLECLIC